MNRLRCALSVTLLLTMSTTGVAGASSHGAPQRVPELGYRVEPNFFRGPFDMGRGEASAVALNSKGHIFLFQRVAPMLAEYDEKGTFVRSVGDGLFTHPHGLRIDAEDNLWAIDDGSHVVLKLSPEGRVLMILGRKGVAAESDWLFNQPTDVAIGANGEVYVADGYGNSRVVKFDRNGKFLKAWGKYGARPGEFKLPHTVAVDREGNVYVGDRENMRIQVFNSEGRFLKAWTGLGYPYGLYITPDQHVWMADGGYDRILELDHDGRILGAYGEPGHEPGHFAWAHFLAVAPDRTIYVADVLNWRFQVLVPTGETGHMSSYVPRRRVFSDQTQSRGWSTRTGKK